MESNSTAEKSCGPQLSDVEMPSKSWGPQRLGDYARRQHNAIVNKEQTLAPCYWRLGHALSLARADYNRGQWAHFLKSLKIEKTRDSKARAIYKAFAWADDVEGMSVDAAYAARNDKSREKKVGTADRQAVLPVKLGKALIKVDSVATQVFENVADLSRPEMQDLLTNLRHAISRLQDHVQRLEMELEASAAAAG